MVFQLLSLVWLFMTPWTAVRQGSLSFIISQSLLKLMSIRSVILFIHLILCHPFILLPSVFPSIRVFSNELAILIRWPKYWIFSFSVQGWFLLGLTCLISLQSIGNRWSNNSLKGICPQRMDSEPLCCIVSETCNSKREEWSDF